jgi:hypothetical protein
MNHQRGMPMSLSRLLLPADRLVAALSDPARRARAILGVLAGYVAIWTLYGALAKASQDIHFDMAELAAWSRELAFGYPKLPGSRLGVLPARHNGCCGGVVDRLAAV